MRASKSSRNEEASAINVLTVRDLPDDVLRALQRRALRNGWSADSEVCEILSKAVKPEKRVRMGDALAAGTIPSAGREKRVRMGDALADLGRASGLTNEDFARMDKAGQRR